MCTLLVFRARNSFNSCMYVRWIFHEHQPIPIINDQKSIELHQLRCKPQQPIQSMQRELPCKQIADVGALPIVLASASMPQPLQKINGHI
jgi:hypothetical protein